MDMYMQEMIEEWKDIKYFYILHLGKVKDTNDVSITCFMGDEFAFRAPDWQLGYNFFEEFVSHVERFTSIGIMGYKLNQEALLNTYIHIAEVIEKWKERKVKGQQGIRLTPSTLCNICKHRTSYTTCKAFPSGIPSELHNKLHTEKLPSQNNDIIFELGEEGSKVANIKPIKNVVMYRDYYDDDGLDFIEKIQDGLEEEYRE